MAAVRRDGRGIVLEKGESQDKSGKYRYRYYDDMQQAHDIFMETSTGRPDAGREKARIKFEGNEKKYSEGSDG